jgi:hypothetical protein
LGQREHGHSARVSKDYPDRSRKESVYQVYISWRIIEMDRGEVDVCHRNIGLGYNWQD